MARIACERTLLPIGRPAGPSRTGATSSPMASTRSSSAFRPAARPRAASRPAERSPRELRIAMPMSRAALRQVVAETLRRNAIRHAIVYIQVTRGTAPRNHLFPKNAVPSLVVTVRRAPFPKPAEIEDGVDVITLPDQRWKRCDIKSIGLLPNVLAKQKAAEQGAREAGSSTPTACHRERRPPHIIDQSGTIITRPLGGRSWAASPGRTSLPRPGRPACHRGAAFTVARAERARSVPDEHLEPVLPVTRIDSEHRQRPGSITCRLPTPISGAGPRRRHLIVASGKKTLWRFYLGLARVGP